MTLKVAHVMAKKMIFASPEHTIAHARDLMASKHVHALPVVGPNRQMRGIITTTDLARRQWDEEAPVTEAMSTEVFTIRATADIREAARIMRSKRIHHVLVVSEKQAIGMVSTFDLLKLIEMNVFRHDNQEDPPVEQVLI